jgi:hypothetical protein
MDNAKLQWARLFAIHCKLLLEFISSFHCQNLNHLARQALMGGLFLEEY